MSMPPVDVPVPTLLTRSVVLEPDRVRILDRRIFPHEVRYVDCLTVDEVAQAIEQMVTQSSGPYFAAGAAMVLAARVASAVPDPARRIQVLREAGERLVATRKTNNNIAQAGARPRRAAASKGRRCPTPWRRRCARCGSSGAPTRV